MIQESVLQKHTERSVCFGIAGGQVPGPPEEAVVEEPVGGPAVSFRHPRPSGRFPVDDERYKRG